MTLKLFWRLLLADCRLHLNKYNASQTKKSNYTSNTFFPKMVLVFLGSFYHADVCWNVCLPHCSYCSDLGSKWITTAQSSKWIATTQILAPNESLLLRLGLQMNHFCSDSGSKWITSAQTRAPNESLLLRLGLQMMKLVQDNSGHIWDILTSLFYCGRKWRCIVTKQIWKITTPEYIYIYALVYTFKP